MKLQFSLATLLVCITVLAVVCGLAISITVEKKAQWPSRSKLEWGAVSGYYYGPAIEVVYQEKPTATQITHRLALWGPVSLVATLGVPWIGRRVMTQSTPSRSSRSACLASLVKPPPE